MELALIILALVAVSSAIGLTVCRVWGVEKRGEVLRIILDAVMAVLLGFSLIIIIVLLEYFH